MVACREAGRQGERSCGREERGVVCRCVPELTYEQARVASEVDVAFHIEDKESSRQSFSPSLPHSSLPPPLVRLFLSFILQEH